MKIIRHDAYIATRKRNSKLVAALGFVLLIGTLFLALNPNMILISYILMLSGFVLFNIGMQQVGRWTRNPRNDQAIDHHLKNLPDRYSVIHYAPVNTKRVDHVVIHPGGALILTSKEVDGTIVENASRWRRRGSGLRRFFSFSGPQLGNPSIETEESIKRLESLLAEKAMEVDVEGAVVFLNPMAELDITDPDYPVLHGDELQQFVARLPADEALTSAERDQLITILSDGAAPVTMSAGGAAKGNPGTGRRRPVKRSAEAVSTSVASSTERRRPAKRGTSN